MATALETLPGSESTACRDKDGWRNWGSPWGSRQMSSGSKARAPSDRHDPTGGGSAGSTKEAGQCPRRKAAEQDSALDEGYTAAPEAEPTVATKLAELAARARRERTLTNVIQFVDEELLRLAFRSLRKQAAPGVDGQSYEEYAANLNQNLKDVHARLTTGRYKAPVIRRVYIPKGNGKRRPIGISTVEDRTVQKAAAWVLSAVFEQDFLECSHGFRPARSAHTALHRLRDGMQEHRARYVAETDLASYFDTVNHEWLRKFVRHRVNDGGRLRLLNKWLKAGVMENGVVTRMEEGVPQGGPVSCVLANVVLHQLDRLWEDRCSQLGQLIRYADDAVVLCRTEAQAKEALRRIGIILKRLKLTLHPDKTQVVWVGDGRQGFDFLGFHCRKVESWKYRGKRYLQRWPSQRAMQRVRGRVKAITAPRHRLPEPIEPIVAEVNQVVRGWGAYFRVGNSTRKFH